MKHNNKVGNRRKHARQALKESAAARTVFNTVSFATTSIHLQGTSLTSSAARTTRVHTDQSSNRVSNSDSYRFKVLPASDFRLYRASAHLIPRSRARYGTPRIRWQAAIGSPRRVASCPSTYQKRTHSEHPYGRQSAPRPHTASQQLRLLHT